MWQPHSGNSRLTFTEQALHVFARAVKSLASERSLTLRAVYLDGAELTDLSIGYLVGCQLLGVLSLSFCEQLTDAALLMLEVSSTVVSYDGLASVGVFCWWPHR